KGTGNLIRNCVVAAAITAKGDYCGGFVGHGSSSETTIEGCVFTGSITGSGACNAGVFWGRSESDAKITIRNCLENGTAYSSFNFNPVGMGYAAEKVIDNVGYRTAQNGSPNRNWDNAGTKLYAIERGENVSLVFGEAATFYDVSGLGVYDSGLMLCGADAFAPANSTVTLTASYTGDVPDGFAAEFSASAGTLADGALTMPAQDMTISATLVRSSKAIELAANGKAGNILGAQQSSVWFGNYMQSGNKTDGWKVDPVKWRVLSNADGKLFLLADQNLDVVQYNEANTSVTWADCTLRKWLNGYENHPYDDTFIGSAFSEKELTAVADSKVENANNPEYNTNGGDDTTDKVFLLSIAEATNTAYGFTDNVKNTDTRISTNTQYVANGGHTGGGMYGVGGGADYWWLRSPGRYDDLAAFVSYVGYLFRNGNYVDRNYVAVRPAFKMNLNSVLFTSAAENGKQGDGLTAVGDYDGSDWKLTLLDESRKFYTGVFAAEAMAGETLPISYIGATWGENEYIIAILTDETGAALYYGRLAQPTAADGTVTVTIPADLAAGEYTLKLFSEQYNGDKKTDYASAFSNVTLTVKPAAPIKTINLVSGKADYIKGAQTSNVWFGNYKQSGNKTDGWSVDPI
ncbi:MAG: hypothetical protein IKW76_13370, partial [Clostridia bacterium]|nr:hypothetical protein [Clostridia bacterium]